MLRCQRILAMPGKRCVRRTVEFLVRAEMGGLLAAPDRPRMWSGVATMPLSFWLPNLVVWLAEFGLEALFALGVSGVPDGLVVCDLVFDHGVKDYCDLVGGCHGGSFGPKLGFHWVQVGA